ncbi:MAG: bifunctional hydroxymethylpyrimidine kinase/phosphomethylpyrimidine kinase [Rudaea sp.]
MKSRHRQTSVLTIAGSDSGGGAGIQADLKTFCAFNVHGLSAVTAVTAQNTRRIVSTHCVPATAVAAQIQALYDDFDIRAVKIGMLGSAANVVAVAETLAQVRAQNIVLDPVLVATSGSPLLSPRGLTTVRRKLLPMVDVLTPNLPEAEALLGRRLSSALAIRDAARELLSAGPKFVLIKGGHARGGQVSDYLAGVTGAFEYRHPRLPLRAHGTGCVLSAAIAAGLARDRSLRKAVNEAEKFLQHALRHSYRAGKSATRVLATNKRVHD